MGLSVVQGLEHPGRPGLPGLLPESSAMSRLRRRLYYEGQVQGVGFRMRARRLATAYPITGYVRNLDDGRVELLVEGESSTLTAYLEAVQREFASQIDSVEEGPESTEFQPLGGFSILF